MNSYSTNSFFLLTLCLGLYLCSSGEDSPLSFASFIALVLAVVILAAGEIPEARIPPETRVKQCGGQTPPLTDEDPSPVVRNAPF